ncbi:AAA family ATPase [Helicobacter pylori]
MEKRENKINIKKIKSFKAFCGLDAIEMGEFEHYNIIFGNNGCGKTSLTRAFELLISKNKHIEKYRTISADKSPSIEFECKDESYTIEPNSDIGVPFKVEIYNSDFLHNNTPLNSEFGLKKLDDGTIILEGSVLGEETKEINQLKDFREKVEKRQKKIKDENDIENTLIAKQKSEIKKYDKEIEKIRKKMTSKTIQIALDEIGINNFYKVSKDKFKYQEDILKDLEKDFNEFNEAMKKFDGLKETKLPKDDQTIKDKLKFLFSFDIDKEAGKVSEKIKEHISKVGREFIEKGIKLQKEMPDNACPFCTQKIPHEIIQEYTSYFNESVETFNQYSLEMSGTLKNILNQWNIKEILQSFEKFEPFMKKDFSKNKESLEKALEQIKVLLEKLQKEVDKKEGAKNKEEFQKIDKKLLEIQENIQKHVNETRKILNEKKKQKEKLEKLKTDLKEARIKKAKHDSYDWQKIKKEAEIKLSVLNRGYERLNCLLEKIDNKLKRLNEQKRPDIEIINNYLKVLNLPKYSLNKDYRIVLNSDALENSEARMILSDGEKTTLAFAYFLARLKSFYKKENLKNLVVVIDDPISSLDEQRIYNTSNIVAKINQELVGEALEKDEEAQVFVLTHNHTFMARLINMVGKNARYFQLERHQNQLKIVCKNKVVGYFDTFYLLLFKEVYVFAKKEKVQDNFNEAINYGNKVRVLLESFLKINFINSFLGANNVFEEGKIKKLIETANREVELNFSNLPFNKDNNCNIENKDMLFKKFLRIVKGLHLDSHGSVVDFFSPYKIPLENVQKFAKIAINVMKILNPYQTQSYIIMGSVGEKTKNKE